MENFSRHHEWLQKIHDPTVINADKKIVPAGCIDILLHVVWSEKGNHVHVSLKALNRILSTRGS